MKIDLILLSICVIFYQAQAGQYLDGPISLNWISNDQSTTNFSMSSSGMSNGNYFAFGFSKDQQMGEDDVTVCQINSAGIAKLYHYYNTGRTRPVYLNESDPTIGFSNIETSLTNGVLKCSFTRVNKISAVSNYFDLSYKYFVLTASGGLNANSLKFHSSYKSSDTIINFFDNSVTSTVQTSTTTTKSSTLANIDIKWKSVNNLINFEMSSQTLTDRYVAFGLSEDQSMGDDDVISCSVYPNGTAGLNHYLNQGKYPLPKSLNGTSNISTTYINGMAKCSFSRPFSENSDFFDLNKKYYIITASGMSSNMIKHTSRASSSVQFDFKKDNMYSVGSNSGSLAKAQAHGCLMIFAWMFCASTGILIARYYKYIFPKVKLMNVQFWFFIHRPLMISVPILSIISFIVILSYMDWKWVDSSSQPEYAHSITGILTIAFSVVQVFLAFFRCDKDHPKRFIFNHFHRIFGISTFILAIVSLFLGVLISDMNLGTNGWGVMIGWTIWILACPFILELFDFFFVHGKVKSNNNKANVEKTNNEEKSSNNSLVDKKSKNLVVKLEILQNAKSFLLPLHLLIAMTFTLALILLISSAEKSSS